MNPRRRITVRWAILELAVMVLSHSFRAGDWKCGSEGCGNITTLLRTPTVFRCGAPRSGAAVVARLCISLTNGGHHLDLAWVQGSVSRYTCSSTLPDRRRWWWLWWIWAAIRWPPSNYGLAIWFAETLHGPYPPTGQINAGYVLS